MTCPPTDTLRVWLLLLSQALIRRCHHRKCPQLPRRSHRGHPRQPQVSHLVWFRQPCRLRFLPSYRRLDHHVCLLLSLHCSPLFSLADNRLVCLPPNRTYNRLHGLPGYHLLSPVGNRARSLLTSHLCSRPVNRSPLQLPSLHLNRRNCQRDNQLLSQQQPRQFLRQQILRGFPQQPLLSVPHLNRANSRPDNQVCSQRRFHHLCLLSSQPFAQVGCLLVFPLLPRVDNQAQDLRCCQLLSQLCNLQDLHLPNPSLCRHHRLAAILLHNRPLTQARFLQCCHRVRLLECLPDILLANLRADPVHGRPGLQAPFHRSNHLANLSLTLRARQLAFLLQYQVGAHQLRRAENPHDNQWQHQVVFPALNHR
jgi:hypothetical protein